jgi:hypothetical protein
MHIGIIGSAGRGDTGAKWNRDVYYAALRKIRELLPPGEYVHLHSGGAAWADHLAVSTFLAQGVNALTLHLPCPFYVAGQDPPSGWTEGPVPGFQDNSERNFITNPGGTLNYYHRRFSAVIEGNSLAGISKAVNQGATLKDEPYRWAKGNRLLARNLGIGANLDMLIAFTWGPGSRPADGGTAHCWDHSNCKNKIHIPLDTLDPRF